VLQRAQQAESASRVSMSPKIQERRTRRRKSNLSLHFGLDGRSRTLFSRADAGLEVHHALMMAILHDRIGIAKAVTPQSSLWMRTPSYATSTRAVARKFVIDPMAV